MKKLTQFVGVFATGLISAATLAGCSATPDDPGTAMTAGTGGMGAAGAAGTGGAQGTQLNPPNSYTVLKGADAMPSATPAPAGWTTAGCNSCHGTNGEGQPFIGPEIRHTPTAYATWVVRNGRPTPSAMLAFPAVSPDGKAFAISDADLTAVLAWLAGQPKPTTGEGLYKDFCGNCHGPTMATGGAVPVSVIGKMASEISQKVRMGEGADPALRNGFMPAEDMASLTEPELDLIKAYLMAK